MREEPPAGSSLRRLSHDLERDQEKLLDFFGSITRQNNNWSIHPDSIGRDIALARKRMEPECVD
jgi:hypothetical protein